MDSFRSRTTNPICTSGGRPSVASDGVRLMGFPRRAISLWGLSGAARELLVGNRSDAAPDAPPRKDTVGVGQSAHVDVGAHPDRGATGGIQPAEGGAVLAPHLAAGFIDLKAAEGQH